MRAIGRLLVVMNAVIAFGLLVPVGAAGSTHDFYLDKTCSEDASEPLGFFCTVWHSDFKWIPAGTDIHYAAGPTDDAQVATIEIRNGSTSGLCVWSSAVDAICSFHEGTGRLTQFNLEVVVTANDDQSIWYWEGSYWFGERD